jgi:hypothetical protein
MKNIFAGLLMGIAVFGIAGCITHDETVVRDVSRLPVEFESDLAARTFYETLSKHPNSGTRTESSTKVEIPIVFDHKQKVVSGPNAAFNEAVGVCDSNKDGKITESEARIFAELRQGKK